MKIAFNPSTVAALTSPPDNKDITFDLRGQNIFARGVKFQGTDTNTWRDIKVNNVSIGSYTLDLRDGDNTTLTNINGVVTINSTWRPVVDNLTSDSTTSSLSANQGRVLAGLINGKSDSGHTHDGRYLRLNGSDTMQGNLNLCSIGTSYIGKGLGDKSGADFTEANIVIRSWWGISFKSYDDIVRTYIDTRTGNIGTKGVLNAVGAVIQGRVYNGGDDEGIIIKPASNGYAGLILGTHSGERSIFYLTKGKPFWRYNNGSTNLDIQHPKKSGTIALTSDIPNKNSWNYDDRYYTKAESNAKYITDITTSVNKLTFTRNGANIDKDIAVNNVQSLGRRSPLTERNAISGIYTYGTYSATNNLAPSDYFETLGFGEGVAGTIEIGGSWISGGKLYWRALRDCCEDWFSWKTILDSSNYSGILDSRYYTESEVNSLLSNKLNISNFNWTNLSGKLVLVAENEFNIVNAGFNSELWFNYLPINDRSKTASIHTYIMGNGAKGMASVTASGFIKNGGNENQLLRADGGIAAFNWAGQSGQPTWLWGGNDFNSYYVYNPSNFRVAYAASAGNADTVDGYHANGLLTALSNSDKGISITVGGTTKSVSNISVNYASSAGNADTLDGEHASNFVRAGRFESADLNKLDTYSFIKSVNSTNKDTSPKGNIGWYNVIQAVHRNGASDGPGYIGQIALGMTINTDDMFFRGKRTDPWKTVIHSGNYTEFINNYYWANVKISASSSTTTSPIVSNLTATNSIRMNNISLEHTNEINNITNGGLHLNYRNSGNVSLCQGGGSVGIGTTTPSYKLDVNGQMRASGFHHSSMDSDNYMLLAGGGYKSFGGSYDNPIFLGYLNLDHGNDDTISSSFYCLGYSVPFTYTRGGNYCRISIPNTTHQVFYIRAAIASVHYSGGGMDTWVGDHRSTGAWWLHCYAQSYNEVRVKGFRNANSNNDSWWGGNPLYSNNDGANRITVCIFGYVTFR